jgi:hypothetical protein
MEAIRYRKLPGHRRGIFRGSSVWLGPDHLLLVRNVRFREEYKRFYLRDIQALVVARMGRFHLSTRAFGIAFLWLMAVLFLRHRAEWISDLLWTLAVLLPVVWLYVSGRCSCRCRIYTAVSRDELPSLYRTWTARRFLREVEPLIAQVQGVLAGEWAQAVENRSVGPPVYVPPPPPPLPGTMAASIAPSPPSLPVQARSRSFASDLMIGALFADAIFSTIELHSTARWAQSVNGLLALVIIASAILVVVQHYRGTLRTGMQRLGIATLIAEGLFYYARPVFVGAVAGARAAASHQPAVTNVGLEPWMREMDAVVAAVLGFIGLAMMLFGSRDEDDGKGQIITPSA